MLLPFFHTCSGWRSKRGTSVFKYFLCFRYRYLGHVFLITCDFISMIRGLQISSLTVKQQRKSPRHFSGVFFSVVAFVDFCPPKGGRHAFFFFCKQFRACSKLSTKLCTGTDTLTLKMLTLW